MCPADLSPEPLGTQIGHDIEVPSSLAQDRNMCPQAKGWLVGSCPQITPPSAALHVGLVDPLPDLTLPVPFSHQGVWMEPLGLFLNGPIGPSEPCCLKSWVERKLNPL